MPDRRVVVLLRAVNLGARNKVPMAALRTYLTDAGATDVSTYIASGNIICVPPGGRSAFETLVEDLVAREFGVRTEAVTRTPAQLRSARESFPFDVHDPTLCAIAFLKGAPSQGAASRVEELAGGDDRCALIGRELHVRYENTVHTSRVSAAVIGRALGTPATARNVRTVEKLVALTS